jgi:hypothetical protein
MYRLYLVNSWQARIHRLSFNQLRALEVLARSEKGIVEAAAAEKKLGLKGKALGGVFSSLSRQVLNGEHLVEAWGRSMGGRGLRWKLNEKQIAKKELLEIVEEVLETG